MMIRETVEAISRSGSCSDIKGIRDDFASFPFARDQLAPGPPVLSHNFTTRVLLLLEELISSMMMHCINHSVNPAVRTSVHHKLQ